MNNLDSNGMPLMAYWPHVGPPLAPDVEHLRQTYSGVSLVCDHLNDFYPSESLTVMQQAELDVVHVLLRAVHHRLKDLSSELQGKGIRSGPSVGLRRL